MFRTFKNMVSDQRGQSLVVVVLAMGVIMCMAAFAIDASNWYLKHHEAQVTADAASLAAANYMAQNGTAGTATTVATTYASDNGITLSATNVNVNTTAATVTVTVPTNSPSAFAGLFGLSDPALRASAVASYSAKVAYSLFAGNSGCTSNVDSSGNNDGFLFEGSGGGATILSGVHSNGLVTDNDHSGSEALTGTYTTGCSKDKVDSNASPQISGESGTIPFPIAYNAPGSASGPTCTSSASSFTDSQITSGTASSPNIYCATGTCNGLTQASGNTPTSGQAGSITLSHTVTNVELYANCVVLDSGANGSTAPANEPLVYGSESDSSSTNNNGTNSTVFFAGNNITLTGTVYVPTGTVEFTFNNNVITFVEAENIVIDKNSASSANIAGNGPLEVVPGDELTQ
jgi:Flp pilus assembly protein TadG